MCGIAGMVRLGAAELPLGRIADMCDSLAHRGPDDAGYAYFRAPRAGSKDSGYWCSFTAPQFRHLNENLPPLGGAFCNQELSKNQFDLALGHRRLSIIDLTHLGHQPLHNNDRSLWVVYNGEIYNFPELKRELTAKGHLFRTRTDTEVILHLWEEYGPESLAMLNGMFALALYDQTRGLLTLARDRFGVKPLYYAANSRHLLFGSECKAILASGLWEAAIDPKVLAEYMTFQNIFSDGTLFEGIKLLPNGSFLQIDLKGERRVSEPRPFCRIPSRAPGGLDQAEWPRLVADGFAESVKRQLISDVPVGAYLSGGMDSGSIVSVARQYIPRLLTFTGGFDLTNVNGIEQGFDERLMAEDLAHRFQTEHYEVVLHAGDMPAVMEQLTWHVDDPRVGICHQNWYTAKLASKFVKVCLSGVGGDELFGGYPWRYHYTLDMDSPRDQAQAIYGYWHRLLSRERLPKLYANGFADYQQYAWQSFENVFEQGQDIARRNGEPHLGLYTAMYIDFSTFLRGLLVVEDRVSMAHSLEARVPFLDNDLADLAFAIPCSEHVDLPGLHQAKGTYLEGPQGKKILRQAMESFLPAQIIGQKKQGFSPPDANWYRGPSVSYIREILQDSKTLSRPWFDQAVVEQALKEHFNGQHNHRLLIWSLLSLELLQRHFVDR